VAPYIRAVAKGEPLELTITRQDVARGFIDVHEAGVLDLQTNNPTGTMLLLSLETGPVSTVRVTIAGSNRTVGAGGGWIEIPFSGTAKQSLELSCRLFLRPDSEPGVVPWPVVLNARMKEMRR
jgi:hypothetical protein